MQKANATLITSQINLFMGVCFQLTTAMYIIVPISSVATMATALSLLSPISLNAITVKL